MHRLTASTLAVGLGLVFVGCGEGAEPTGFRITVAPLDLDEVANLCAKITVFNTTDAGLMDAQHTVWSQSGVCADDYGDGSGSLAYVGTCDASGGTPQNPTLNTVELEIEAILVDGQDALEDDIETPWDETTTHELSHPGDYFNPCLDHGCRLQRPCVENADTPVEFKLTVMRNAKQGFFDVAVDFADVFCSAKFDCQYARDANGDDVDDAIELLFDASGRRSDTGVLAFACTAGKATPLESDETHLYMDDIQIYCTDSEDNELYYESFSPADDADPDDDSPGTVFGPGNQLVTPRGGDATVEVECECFGDFNAYTCATAAQCDGDLTTLCDAACDAAEPGSFQNGLSPMACLSGTSELCGDGGSAIVYQWATYEGHEFPAGGTGFQKDYWNVAFGFDVDAMAGLQCVLYTKATASNGPLAGNTTNPGEVYPYLEFEINLNDPARPGTGLTCGQNPVSLPVGTLFAADSGVRPRYTELPDGWVDFDNCGTFDGSAFKTHVGECQGEVMSQ